MSIVSGVVSAATNFVIAFVFAMYIVLQKERLSVQVRKIMYAFLPRKGADWINRVASLAYTTFSHFFTGQCLEAVILGTMFFVAMTIFRFPYALLVGILVAFTALIPIFGAFIGCVVGAFLILMENPMQAVLFVVMFLILQQIEGNLIYPHVVGNSVGLPSIWVLVAVTVGGSLMGIVGMLVFIPLMSVCYTLFRQWVYDRLKKRELIIIFKGEKKNETVQRDGEKQAEQMASDYRSFLDAGKTERECAANICAIARAHGFRDLEEILEKGESLKAGDKIYAVNMKKAVLLMQIGQESLEKGMNLIGSHIDSPDWISSRIPFMRTAVWPIWIPIITAVSKNISGWPLPWRCTAPWSAPTAPCWSFPSGKRTRIRWWVSPTC